jgi:hypothetical protein
MRVVGILGLGLMAALFTFPAEALTITNTDSNPATIKVIIGNDSKEMTIEPDAKVEPACDKGCIVELDNGDQYQMQGGEEASIEGGMLFYDSVPGADDEDYPDVDVTNPDGPMSPSDQGTDETAQDQ